MKVFSSKRRVVTAAVLILLALFLVRPGVSRLKARIANSISRAVARPADIGAVHLRFLPPGFDLQNLVIYEDPAFGAEPMLRAPEVMAVVRLSSLVRGRLDISRLELTEPSLNLVRRPDGRWNWAALLERTAHTPLAPTAKSKSEARPSFPYIEATSGRINFKAGPEKKRLRSAECGFCVMAGIGKYVGSAAESGAVAHRHEFERYRTQLRMNGTWQRASNLRETPLQFSMQWTGVQLGQLSKLILGDDKGWRGELRLDAALNGTPAAMQVTTDTSIENFHRYDISSSEGLRLAVHCNGEYHSTEAVMRDILCSSPVGGGMITLKGAAGLPAIHKLDLALKMENVPVYALAQLARRAKKSLPDDLLSTGTVQGDFAVNEDTSSMDAQFQGRGQIANLRLRSANTKVEFAAASIPFALSNGGGIHARLKTGQAHELNADVLPAPDGLHIDLGPFPVALGRPSPAQARGWLGRSGYSLMVRGDGEVARTLRLANLLGLPAVRASVEGVAQIDLQIAGGWSGNVSGTSKGFALPEVTGTVQLHNVRAAVKGVNGPIEISSAELRLARDGARVYKLNAQAADAHWTGNLALPRGCGAPGACLVHFNLSAEELSLQDVYEWLSARPSRRPWYQVLSSAEPAAPSFLGNLRASGRMNAGRVLLHDVVASRVSASVDLERGKLSVIDLRADVLGGKHRGDWHADFSGGIPVYAGSGTLTGISLQLIADAMRDPWITGTAAAAYQFTASGADSADFWQSSEGDLQFDLRDGVLSHVSLTKDEGPLRIGRWQGDARLRASKIEIDKGKLISPTGAYEVSGTASFGQTLDLKLTQGSDLKAVPGSLVYSITGTVAEPRVALIPTPETQARLKSVSNR